jgi:hypothetical protein
MDEHRPTTKVHLRPNGANATIGVMSSLRLPICLLFLAFTALVLGAAARADDDDDDVTSRAGICTTSSTARLDLRKGDRSGHGGGDDKRIEVTFTVDSRRNGVSWRVILLHERRIVFRGKLRTRPPKGIFVLSGAVSDYYGSDAIAARATSSSGEVCRASASL